MNGACSNVPLVSVGIPTYDRPVGLRRTLECITRQTYPNLEIIVSDNASPNNETEALVAEYAARDPRISYFRQPLNLGALGNFQFVLRVSCGKFFMWAADDDEWDSTFVEFCVRNIGESGSIMTGFFVKNRHTNGVTIGELPDLSGNPRQPSDIQNYINRMQSSMFYGLHHRQVLGFVSELRAFDWLDCYVCMRLIWTHGFRCRNDVQLYTAGIDAETYIIKPYEKERLSPRTFFLRSLRYIFFSRSLFTLLLLYKILFLHRR